MRSRILKWGCVCPSDGPSLASFLSSVNFTRNHSITHPECSRGPSMLSTTTTSSSGTTTSTPDASLFGPRLKINVSFFLQINWNQIRLPSGVFPSGMNQIFDLGRHWSWREVVWHMIKIGRYQVVSHLQVGLILHFKVTNLNYHTIKWNFRFSSP